jgi:hypothetical protein
MAIQTGSFRGFMPKQLQSKLAKFSEDLLRKGDPFEKFDTFLKHFGVKGYSYGFAVLRAEMTREDRTKSVSPLFGPFARCLAREI